MAATTTVDVIQEFAHVHARRRASALAAAHARRFATVLGPLAVVSESALELGLGLFEQYLRLDAFDAVLAAVALEHGAEALVSADAAFGEVSGLRHVSPAGPELDELISG